MRPALCVDCKRDGQIPCPVCYERIGYTVPYEPRMAYCEGCGTFFPKQFYVDTHPDTVVYPGLTTSRVINRKLKGTEKAERVWREIERALSPEEAA